MRPHAGALDPPTSHPERTVTADPFSPPPAEDHEILRASLEDPEAFGRLFERHARPVHRYLARRTGELADDLLGEVFTAAFAARRTYVPRAADARPWLFGIAANLVRRHHREEAARYRLLARAERPGAAPDSAHVAVDLADADALRPRLAGALLELRDGDREVLLLLAWAQLDQAEVAHALGIPVGTVRSRLHRARRLLRPLLDDLQGDLR